MSDLQPGERLAKLRTLEEWLSWQLESTRRKIRDLEQQAPPEPARYVIEPKIHATHPLPATIHLADCTMAERKTMPITVDEVRIGLTRETDIVRPCEFCAPDKALGLGG